MDLGGRGVDAVDLGLDVVHVAVELSLARTHEVLGVGEAERDEQEPRLVDVGVVAVDDRDLGLAGRVHAPQAIGHDRAAGAAAEDEDSLCHRPRIASGCSFVIGNIALRRCGHSVAGAIGTAFPHERIGAAPEASCASARR